MTARSLTATCLFASLFTALSAAPVLAQDGACCFGSGACMITSETICVAEQGEFLGVETSCDDCDDDNNNTNENQNQNQNQNENNNTNDNSDNTNNNENGNDNENNNGSGGGDGGPFDFILELIGGFCGNGAATLNMAGVCTFLLACRWRIRRRR